MPALRRHFEPFLYEESYRLARLVSAARGGSREAFDGLMNEFERPLRAFLRHRVGESALDDVLQETRVACWLGLPAFHGRSRFKVWLLGIAHHKGLDCLRTHRRPFADVSLDEEAETQPFARNDFQAADTRMVVAALLDQMPEVQKEVLELYYFGDLTLEETAQALGRSLNTVKSQFYRAHEKALDVLRADDAAAFPAAEARPTRLGIGKAAT